MTILDYSSQRIIFINPVQKTLLSVSVYTKPGNQFSEIFLRQIFDPMHNRNFHIWQRLHMKRTSIDCTGSFFLPPLEVELYRMAEPIGLIRSRVKKTTTKRGQTHTASQHV